MRVSVVMPVYNSSEYLNESIGSVIKQTFGDLEIILVENGSTDNSLEVCNRYKESDERITVIHTDDNIGTGAARNLGFEKTSGEYVCFLDSDDRFDSTMIEKLVKASDGADAVLCGYAAFREDGGEEPHGFGSYRFENSKEVRNYVAEWFPDGRVGFIGNKMYKASVIRENGITFPLMSRLEDGFFNLDYFSHAQSLIVIPDILYYYRLSPASAVIQKHDAGYADLVMSLTDATFEKRNDWGVDAPSDEVYKFCLNELGTGIENVFVGDWGMNVLERRSYLKQMTLMDTYEDAIKHLEVIGLYRRLLHILLNREQYLLLGLIVRLKTFGKGKLSWLYYRLKK